jgi:hypothetical protein
MAEELKKIITTEKLNYSQAESLILRHGFIFMFMLHGNLCFKFSDLSILALLRS